MNVLKGEKLARLLDAFDRGMSGRAAARYAGCSKITAWKWAKAKHLYRYCQCGALGDHRGWCWWRFQNSPFRQEWMARVRYDGFHGARKPNPYRFKPGALATDPLMELIKQHVPRTLPVQIRDEMCQDVAVAVLSGDATPEQIPSIVRDYVKSVFRTTQPWFERLSLDAPLPDGSGRTFKDIT